MKKKVLTGVIALSLVSGTAGAAVNQFAQKADILKKQYAHSYEQILKDFDPDTREFEQSELERMEKAADKYFQFKMTNLKQNKTEEEKAAIKAETDKYIQEIRSFIDGLGN